MAYWYHLAYLLIHYIRWCPYANNFTFFWEINTYIFSWHVVIPIRCSIYANNRRNSTNPVRKLKSIKNSHKEKRSKLDDCSSLSHWFSQAFKALCLKTYVNIFYMALQGAERMGVIHLTNIYWVSIICQGLLWH